MPPTPPSPSRGAILVTGAASGIGRCTVGAWSARGERVVATDIDVPRLALAAAADGWPTERVMTAPLDVADSSAWTRVWDLAEARLGPIDRLVNNAGLLLPDWIGAVTDADVDRLFDVNAKGVVYGTREAARRFVPRRGGHIVNVGSLAGMAPIPGLSLYVASKFAVRGFTLAVGTELAKQGVAVTLVMPDAVWTPMITDQLDRDELAITLSGGRGLKPEAVLAAIDTAFRTKPIELCLPASRAALARIAGAFPRLSRWVEPLMTLAGKRKLATFRREPAP